MWGCGLIKRAFDLNVSLFSLILLSPLILAIALWIKLDSRGPVFYRGVRVGRFGRSFRIYKFRTMVADAEKISGSSTADDDPRITRIGKILRRYKLDETPQLINVVKGDMSLVGPRPEVREYVDMYTEEEKAILQVRPGITDWASLWNSDEGAVLAGCGDPDRAYLELIRPTKIKLQLKYLRHHPLWVDLKILLLTLLKVSRKDRAPGEVLEAVSAKRGASHGA